ncbi:MAG: ATP-binding protein [Chthoniobacteraceae bacterium]
MNDPSVENHTMPQDEAVLLLSRTGQIRWANEAASAMLGYTPEELCQMALPVSNLSAEAALGPVANAMQAILAGERREIVGDARFPDKSQGRIAARWRLARLPSTGSEALVLLTISERTRSGADGVIISDYQKALERAEDTVGERDDTWEQLRDLAARSQNIREEERTRIAREIHDELGQALTLFKLDLSWLTGRIVKVVDDAQRVPLEEKIAGMAEMIDSTLTTVRRISSALRPPLLDELGLKAAIEFHMEEFSKRAALRYDLEIGAVDSLDASLSTGVFRILQEILTNVARHAKASRVKVILSERDDQLVLKVEDNGRGISQKDVRESGHLGIMGMQERAWAMGGGLEIHRRSQGGTRITLKVPILAPKRIEPLRAPVPAEDVLDF